MYSKFDPPKKKEGNRPFNAGSCVKLADYMNKEKEEGKFFFSHVNDNVSLTEVIEKIDNNKRTLKKNQEKFYSLSYNPSEREIRHLVKLTTGKVVNELSELSTEERILVFNEFRSYVRECMEIYAKNFNRDRELTANDLVYFGRIEEFRHFTGFDEEVKLGLKKQGDIKPGLNLHAHIIVSRMDVTQTISLSPRTKSRGNTNMLNGREVKNGFNMSNWQVECFEKFGYKYRYISNSDECFYKNSRSYNEISARLKNKVLREITEGMEEERRLVGTIMRISSVTRSPKATIQRFLKNKIKNILSDREPII